MQKKYFLTNSMRGVSSKSYLLPSFIFLSLQFSNIKKFISFFSGTERHTKLKLGPHIDSRLMYHVYLNQAAGVYLFLYFFNFLSLKFQNIKFFISLFCKAYKVETWYTHGQIVDLLCTPTTSSQNILVPLFFFFFLSLQLAKIKNLLLQNCFNIPLMATAGGMWALLYFIFRPLQFSNIKKSYQVETRYTCGQWVDVSCVLESGCCLFIPLFLHFSSPQFSNNKIFIALFSGTVRPTKLRLGTHIDNGLMYCVYHNQAAAAYLSLYFFTFFLSYFQTLKFFVTLFSGIVRPTKLKLGTCVDNG